jgi:uncharacterized membrane protein
MDTPPPAPAPEPIPVTPVVVNEDKTVAIVGYLTLIGFIIAVVLHGQKKTRLGAYHLRQSLGLMLLWIAGGLFNIVPILGLLVWFVVLIGGFVLWVMGLIAAANGQMKPVPLLGEHFQKWFGTAFD